MKQEFDVDIVIPWVDGGDRKWQEEKNRFLPDEKKINIDADANRYRDWESLQYVFRGIEKFAPWVHKVYFITCGQAPKWLNKNCEKLVCVNHEDYIPKEFLPTFSANPIEINIHRIKGLSEHFVYLNDDFYFTNKVEKEDFFVNGLPRLVAMEKPKTVSKDFVFDNIAMNNVREISTKFEKHSTKNLNKKKWYSLKNPIAFVVNKFYEKTAPTGWAGFYMDHLPTPFLKSKIEECWNVFHDKLESTSKNKFRSIYDVNQYLFTEYMICSNCFELDKYGRKGSYFAIEDDKPGNVENICENIRKKKNKMICINDLKVSNFEETKNKINGAFESILPEKSSFEL